MESVHLNDALHMSLYRPDETKVHVAVAATDRAVQLFPDACTAGGQRSVLLTRRKLVPDTMPCYGFCKINPRQRWSLPLHHHWFEGLPTRLHPDGLYLGISLREGL